MKRLSTALSVLCIAALPAHAEWRLDSGVAIVAPSAGNSNIELLVVHCGAPYHIEVLARGGAVQPDAGGEEQDDYFYKPNKVQIRVDGQAFPMVAAGADVAVVLFAQGTPAQDHMAPVGQAMIAAMKAGTALTLAFDITPQPNGADGTPYETFAEFPLAGSEAVLDEALAGCR